MNIKKTVAKKVKKVVSNINDAIAEIDEKIINEDIEENLRYKQEESLKDKPSK